ncbi:C-type lectin domain family 17, member A-like [Leptodactylus fuscus]|uniref:C-type lectin domain family 17, member A-like n=1 Tax=Leptodactylus fuscus TaxID=238119 RepID=UPI003F4EBFAE
MNNKRMKNPQDHPSDSCIMNDEYANMDELNREAEMIRPEEKDSYNVYMNMEELNGEATMIRSVEKDKSPTTNKESSINVRKIRLILGMLILLTIKFLILVAITGLLLKYSGDQQQMILKYAETFQKDLENVKQNFLQNINAINKTLETICRTCPSGWEPIGLFCYYFSTDTLSWDNSRDECIRKGSTLVSLTNKEQMDALKSTLAKGHYWIGLRRAKEPEKWIWLDGSPLSYSNWNKGEPNNLPNEDCCESTYGNWNDLPCSATMKYISLCPALMLSNSPRYKQVQASTIYRNEKHLGKKSSKNPRQNGI